MTQKQLVEAKIRKIVKEELNSSEKRSHQKAYNKFTELIREETEYSQSDDYKVELLLQMKSFIDSKLKTLNRN